MAVISALGPLLPLSVHQLHATRWWLTLADYELAVVIDGQLHTLFVPAGYRYDRSTIPWEGVISKDQLGCVAPLLHDALYSCEGAPDDTPAMLTLAGLPVLRQPRPQCCPERQFTRAEADEIFRVAMLADGVTPWRARVAFWAVRLLARRW